MKTLQIIIATVLNEVQQTLCTHNFNFKNKTTSVAQAEILQRVYDKILLFLT
jgi:hypothetical protein